jgi:hypothetical protein
MAGNHFFVDYKIRVPEQGSKPHHGKQPDEE